MDNPLKPEDCAVCTGVLRSALNLREVIDKCKACGMSVEEYESLNNAHIEMAQNLKKQFFPMNP